MLVFGPVVVSPVHEHTDEPVVTMPFGAVSSYEFDQLPEQLLPAEFAAHIKSELSKFSRIVREAGIKPE